MNEPELAQLAAAQNHTFPRAQVVRLYVSTDRAELFTWLEENGKDLQPHARVDTWGFAGVPDGCGGTHTIYAASLVGELRAEFREPADATDAAIQKVITAARNVRDGHARLAEMLALDEALNNLDALQNPDSQTAIEPSATAPEPSLTDAERAEIDASWNELASAITDTLDELAAHCPKCASGNVEPLANAPAEINLFVCLDCATTFTHSAP